MKNLKIGLIGLSLIAVFVGITGCGEKKEAAAPVQTEIVAKENEYMDMKEKYKGVFELENKNGEKHKVGIKFQKAERTSDRNVGAEEVKDVTIFTYEYEVLEGNGTFELGTSRFVIKDMDGGVLTNYMGYRDYVPKEISKGEKCVAQGVYSTKDKKLDDRITIELKNDKNEIVAKWTLKMQKRNYISG